MMMDEKTLLRQLDNKAMHYLGRFASSEAGLRQVLLRFAHKKQRQRYSGKDSRADNTSDDNQDAAFAQKLNDAIAKLMQRYRSLGYIDDTAYAHGKALAMRGKGYSRHRIRTGLLAKGIAETIIASVMAEDELGDEDAELDAAIRYARKKRLGVNATEAEKARTGWRQRHLARLIRAGFAYQVATKALEESD